MGRQSQAEKGSAPQKVNGPVEILMWQARPLVTCPLFIHRETIYSSFVQRYSPIWMGLGETRARWLFGDVR
jgi:hypothetical protein